jgi:hypothetical protein
MEPRAKTGGRKKGTPNKLTASVKDAIEQAFDEVGGVQYLVTQARENPAAFMTLIGKVLPKDLNIDLTTKTVAVKDFTGRANV